MQLSVLSTWPKLILNVFERQGIDTEALLARYGIARAQLDDPNSRIPSLAVVRLWQAGRELGDENLLLQVAQSVNAGTFHALGFAMATSETGMHAMQRLAQYYPVLTTSIHLEILESEKQIGIRLTSSELLKTLHKQFSEQGLDDAVRELREAAALGLLNLSRSFFGVEIEAKRIHLQRTLTSEQRIRYQGYVQCVMREGQPFDEVWFERERLLRPLPSANPMLAEINDQIVERYLALLKQDVSARVATEIIKQLPKGTPSQEVIAGSLTMSVRSLQRKLTEQGTNFRKLLSETRRELALAYIVYDSIPVLEIGFRLGFTEPANFSRAFKQWTGLSPLAYREQNRICAVTN